MLEKLLPQNIEAECGALGSIVIDPDGIDLVADFLCPGDFYRDAHCTIYEVILRLHGRHLPADFITICDELERQQKLEDVGGASYIISLVNQVPTSGNVEHYAQIVVRTSILRRLIHAAGQIAAIAYEAGDSDLALERAEQLIFAIGQEQGRSNLLPVAEVLTEYLNDLDHRHKPHGTIPGIPTGFHALDCALGGLQRSDLVTLAARPGQGKTSLSLNIAHNAVYKHNRHIAMFSLEMSRSQLVQRLLSMEAEIDQHRLRMGWLHDADWDRIVSSIDNLYGGTLWIDDMAGLSIAAMRSKARRLQAQSGLDLIIVDYLQLMQATIEGKRHHNREQEIAEISRGLKGIAKELNVPVLALAQLSRAIENRAIKVPQLSDLRESGAIEADSDVVMFIYREEPYTADIEPANRQQQTADIIIAKHRNGPVGYVKLGWNPTQTRFINLEEVSRQSGK